MQWDLADLRNLLETVLPRERGAVELALEHVFPGLGVRRLQLSARRLGDGTDKDGLVLLAIKANGAHAQ